jgi:acylphosphatase
MPAPDSVCRRWVVEGRVQGVGFRWFVTSRAKALGVAGWVANRDDGSVEVVASGTPGLIARLEADLGKGPVGARVTRLTSSEVPHDLVDGNSFTVKH